MADELPTGDKAVFAFLEMIALAFAFSGTERLLDGKPLWGVVGAWAASLVFFMTGIKWPSLRASIDANARLRAVIRLNRHPTFWLLAGALSGTVLWVNGAGLIGRWWRSSPRSFAPQSHLERVYTTRTPVELLNLFHGRTILQGQALFRPYQGLWIRTEGNVVMLGQDGNQGSWAAIRRYQDVGESPIECRFGKQWDIPLGRVNNGDMIKFGGQLQP